MDDLIRLVNTGDKPLTLRHDERGDVTIDPGKQRIVLADYPLIYFGNPNAINEGKNRNREQEFEHCRTMWGFYPGLMPEADWEGLRPQYEAYDMEDQRVLFLIDDPTGEKAGLYTRKVLPSNDELVANQLSALQAQVAQLTAALAATAQSNGVPMSSVPGAQGVDEIEDIQDVIARDDGQSQEERNAQRDEIPKPSADAPVVKQDAPTGGTSRVGTSRVGRPAK